MSWTQVYVTGLSRSIEPSDEEIETNLSARYSLDADGYSLDAHGNGCTIPIMWSGPGSTLIKRDDNGCCRGFAFLTFYSKEGALAVVDRINNNNNHAGDGCEDDIRLRAEISNPKGKKKSKSSNNDDDLADLRLRRQRKQPIRKHPVVTSSNGKRTNLGNKTK